MKNDIKIVTMEDDLKEIEKQSNSQTKTQQNSEADTDLNLDSDKSNSVSSAVESKINLQKEQKNFEIEKSKNHAGIVSDTSTVDKKNKSVSVETKLGSKSADESSNNKSIVNKTGLLNSAISKKIEQRKKDRKSFFDSALRKLRVFGKFRTVEKDKSIENKMPDSAKADKMIEKHKVDRISETRMKHGRVPDDNRKMSEKSREEVSENKTEKQGKSTKKKKDDAKNRYFREYMSPSSRLMYEKQRYYSSASKEIKPKKQKDDLDALKSAAEKKEQQKKQKEHISKREEYKKLKEIIKRKYNIKLFSRSLKIKIVLVSIVFIASISLLTYHLISNVKHPIPTQNSIPIPVTTEKTNVKPVTVGTELKEFSSIENILEVNREDIKKLNFFENRSLAIFSSDKNIKVIKLIIKDGKNILPLKEALSDVKINNFPESLLKAMTNEYNLFVFKTGMNTLRLGIAVKSNNIVSLSKTMKNWEKEKAEGKKMINILKPLFIDDEIVESIGKSFTSANYKNVNVRYIHLPNKDTALNYFVYKDILIFTTSKNTAFDMIDLLVGNKNLF